MTALCRGRFDVRDGNVRMTQFQVASSLRQERSKNRLKMKNLTLNLFCQIVKAYVSLVRRSTDKIEFSLEDNARGASASWPYDLRRSDFIELGLYLKAVDLPESCRHVFTETIETHKMWICNDQSVCRRLNAQSIEAKLTVKRRLDKGVRGRKSKKNKDEEQEMDSEEGQMIDSEEVMDSEEGQEMDPKEGQIKSKTATKGNGKSKSSGASYFSEEAEADSAESDDGDDDDDDEPNYSDADFIDEGVELSINGDETGPVIEILPLNKWTKVKESKVMAKKKKRKTIISSDEEDAEFND